MPLKGGGTAGQRPFRVGEAVRHVLADLFEKGEVRDPGLGNLPVTVTEVRMDAALRHATVYVFPLGGGDTAPVLAALERARPYLRRRLAAAFPFKRVPELQFRADQSFDEAQHIESLLRDPGVARDLSARKRDADAEDGDGP
ncbi:MAG: 30S ribosome-binding factor RbfA [Rhodospirillales bacterium]|nr:MAG: 30S ribosome-binding factor RbfA [Rhodospirillales bacterium]